MKELLFILYVADQAKSGAFYQEVLNREPSLDVPGMTEFTLKNGVKMGLMPNDGIARILGDPLPHPAEGNGIPRCELYLKLENAEAYVRRALNAGAALVSPMQLRSWGDRAAYLADPDGHVLAFAEA
jgi:uncharacterized glyoxalase superfamily protein PhnB